MQIIDKRGFIHIFKWKINIIDFVVICFLIGLVPMGYYAAVIYNKKSTIEVKHEYEATFHCPNCKRDFIEMIAHGKPIPQNHSTVCPICKNKVMVNKTPLSANLSYQEQYYRFLLNRKQTD